MAVTADTVQVRLQADTNAYVRNLNAADNAFTKVASNIEQDAARVTAATRKVGLNTGNIAAQFQDIGVTAAAGMNPLIIALQQGTQLSAVLNDEVAKGVNPVRALGAAFVQVINPISLATIAAIALGAAVLQGIGSIVPKTESANEVMKRHREAIDSIVRGYEGAEQAAAQYFDQVERLPQFAVSEKLRDQFQELADAAGSLPTKLQDVVDYVEALGTSATDTDREIADLVRQFQDGDITLEELYASLGTATQGMGFLEAAAGKLGLGAAKTTEDLRQLILQVTRFGDEYARFMALTQLELGTAPIREDLSNALNLKAYIAQQEELNGYTADELALRKEIDRQMANAGDLGLSYEKAVELAEAAIAADKRRADIKKADKSAAREYEREREAVEKLLAAMGLEAAVLGQTNKEKAIAIALSKANSTATEEELKWIAQTAAFIYDTEKAIKDLNKSSQEWADTIQNATRGFIDDLIAGKSAAEAFSNVLSNIASKLIDVGLNSLFGTGGFNLAGLFGNTSGRAVGGPVSANTPYIVGEKGPEMFVPYAAGKIVPNSQMGGGGSVVFAPNIDARGADVAAVARLEQSVRQLAAEIVPTIRQEIRNGPKKGRTR